MKTKPASISLFRSCLLATLASLPWITTANAQSPGAFSKLNVGNGTGAATGDGTFVAEGKYNISPLLSSTYQTAGSRMLWYPRKSAFRVGYADAVTWKEATMGAYSVAMGYQNKASGYAATAIGFGNTASGYSAAAMGYYNTASGFSAAAMGYNNTASGEGATAMGYYSNIASGVGSTAMGYGNIASGAGSTAMGVSTTASFMGETVIGFCNEPSSESVDPWRWNPNDPVFQIGNGHWWIFESEAQFDFNGDGVIDQNWEEYIPEMHSNALTVYKNGNMELQGNLTLGGAITSAGSPVLTTSSAASVLNGQGFLNVTSLAAVLNSTAPPTSAAWDKAYVSRGDIRSSGQSTGGLLALGSSSTASGYSSIALGDYAQALGYGSISIGSYSNAEITSYDSIAMGAGRVTKGYSFATNYGEATGEISFASGAGCASGDSSIALGGLDWQNGNWPGNQSFGDNSTTVGGVRNVANGFASYASGFWTIAATSQSTAIGSLNLGKGSGVSSWVETDPLFEVGNGSASRNWFDPGVSYRANALTTLKNGQTTLTNKAWKANSAVTLSSENSNGEALVVEGHTVLKGDTVFNGKVTIAVAQGDISMGIYGN